jgi:Zn-dependent metalloprotease
MKPKFTFSLFLLFSLFINLSFAREITGQEAQHKIAGAERIIMNDNSEVPQYVQFRKEAQIPFGNFQTWAHENFNLSAQYGFQLLSTETDAIEMSHYRYQQTWNGFPMAGTMMIVHVRNNMVVSVNGVSFNKVNAATSASLTEGKALSNALNYMNASEYRWQVPQMEELLKKQTNNPDATAYPKGELMLAPNKRNYTDAGYRLSYRFDIYATQPLKR